MRSSTNGLIEAQSIKNYNFQFSRFEIWPKLMYLFRVSFLTNLNIYKAYFKSRHTWIQKKIDYFSLREATAFVRYRFLLGSKVLGLNI